MNVTCIGCGEAFDENYPNNSYLVQAEHSLLLDCGYTIPPQVWQFNDNPNFPDAIYISHGHADHYFGLPPLLTRYWEEEREAPLTLITQTDLIDPVKQVIDYGYKGIRQKLAFDLHFEGVEAGRTLDFEELHCSFAPTKHAIPNLAIRVEHGGQAMCFSGDGNVTPESKALYQGADLLIQETFTLDMDLETHATVQQAVKVAQDCEISHLALSHLHRRARKEQMKDIQALIEKTETPSILTPEPFDELPLANPG